MEVLVADSKIEMSVPHTLVPSSQVPHFVALAVSVARSARAAVVEPEDGVPPQAGVLGVPSLNQDHLTARMHLSNLEA